MKSACQHSFGCSASNRIYDDLGRLRRLGRDQPGPGQIPADRSPGNPHLMMVARCQQIVSGPASSPCPASSFRSATISSATSSEIAAGLVFGRRDRG